jgi:hypothetical protein
VYTLLLLTRYDQNIVANFLMLIWRCWSVRNAVLQAGEKIFIEGSVIFLTRYIEALLHIRQQRPTADDRGKQKMVNEKEPELGRQPKAPKRWSPPSGDSLKINVDGAFINESGAAAVGVVVRDNKGKPLLMA